MSFWSELKRRHVVKVLIVYAAVAFVVIQAADLLIPALHLPALLMTAIVVVALLGLPIAIVLAWAFELTPSGIKRDAAVGDLAAEGPVKPTADRRTIAALPFVNLSDDRENEHFSDGMTEEILSRLAVIGDLRVISRTSVMQYKNTTKPVRTIAEELGVANILEGSVRKSGSRVRVTAQLIEATTDTHLWAESYERELRDVFAVQADVATKIATALHARMTGSEQQRLHVVPTRDTQAYDLYLRGKQSLSRNDPRSLYAGIDFFRQAIARDPAFAAAYAALAQSLLITPYWAGARPPDMKVEARSAIDRALELDASLPEAHNADSTWLTHFEFDWVRGEVASKRALELSPSSPLTFVWYAEHLALRERFSDALRASEQACMLDPFSSYFQQQRANYYIWLQQPDRVHEILNPVIEREPTYPVAHYTLGWAWSMIGEPEKALAAHDRAIQFSGGADFFVSMKAGAYGIAGRADDAQPLYAELLNRATTRWVDPFALAVAAFAIDDVPATISHFEQAERDNSFFFLWFRAALQLPDWQRAGVRDDPRIQRMLYRIWPSDFPQYALKESQPPVIAT